MYELNPVSLVVAAPVKVTGAPLTIWPFTLTEADTWTSTRKLAERV
jgi:hypothetical protein